MRKMTVEEMAMDHWSLFRAHADEEDLIRRRQKDHKVNRQMPPAPIVSCLIEHLHITPHYWRGRPVTLPQNWAWHKLDVVLKDSLIWIFRIPHECDVRVNSQFLRYPPEPTRPPLVGLDCHPVRLVYNDVPKLYFVGYCHTCEIVYWLEA